MFKFRIIGFILLMGLLGGIFFWERGGVWLFMIAAPALAAAAVGEFAGMMNSSGRKTFPVPAALLSWVMIISLMLAVKTMNFDYILGTVHMVLLLIMAAFAGFLSMKPGAMERAVNSFGIIFMLTPPLLLLLLTYFIDPMGYWLLFICLVSKATDTGGYIVGTLTAKLPGGNHKIAPSVSPKKSWEGLAGGMVLSLLATWLFYRFGKVEIPLLWAMIAGAVLSLGSFFGDLTESAIKRFCNVKDSGSFVPGMGGAFDVLDSFIYNGILFWILYVAKDAIWR